MCVLLACRLWQMWRCLWRHQNGGRPLAVGGDQQISTSHSLHFICQWNISHDTQWRCIDSVSVSLRHLSSITSRRVKSDQPPQLQCVSRQQPPYTTPPGPVRVEFEGRLQCLAAPGPGIALLKASHLNFSLTASFEFLPRTEVPKKNKKIWSFHKRHHSEVHGIRSTMW